MEYGETETCMNPVRLPLGMAERAAQQNLNLLKQRFPTSRHPSTDEGIYTHSSTTSSSQSGGSGSNPIGSMNRFKMSAALTQAMVTAAIPVAQQAPAASPGNNASQAIPEIKAAIPEIQASFRKATSGGWQKQRRSITVIEEVSA